MCVSRWPSLCAPCLTKADCQPLISTGTAACFDWGSAGRFCSQPCGPSFACPAGYACEGEPARCMPTSGVCTCTPWAAARNSTTQCAVPNEAGACKAALTCTVAGILPTCAATPASIETCNGIDDDCDGKVDDNADNGCDDGDPCTGDACAGGKCVAFDAIVCGDGSCASACAETADSCPVDCHTCGDGKCSAGESPKACKADCCGSCGDGLCKGYECGEDKGATACALDCGVACGNGICDKGEAFGDCPMDCGFCGDGTCSLCSTLGENPKTCAADCGDLKLIGCTLAWGLFCQDDSPCSDDQCQAGKGCVHLPVDAACTDGNACTIGDACKGGLCAAGPSVPCADGNVCTTDSCDPGSGCVFPAGDGVQCDDASACSVGDICQAGACAPGKALACDDQNPCTTDACDGKTGCTHAATTLGCDDNNQCTVGDKCVGTKCIPGGALNCNDNKPCTDDGCQPTAGCTNAHNAAPCSDGNACTVGEARSGGNCGGKNCDDGKVCTSDSCVAATGCKNVNNTVGCNDGNACTLFDSCEIKQSSFGWTATAFPVCVRRMTFNTSWTVDAKCPW